MPILRVPPSAKLRVASCHIEFALEGLGADARSMIHKLAQIDGILRATPLRPHLVVFPEGADCVPVREYAQRWASDFGATTICGTSQMAGQVGGVVVRPDGTEVTFYKRNLSPHDHAGASSALVRAGTAGIELVFGCPTVDGGSIPVNVRVLICYDFRFHYLEASDFNTTQVVVVPMHDRRHDEPEEYASILAKRYYVRTILVNKAVPSNGETLPSSAFGPLPAPFASQLVAAGAYGVNAGANRLWQTKQEGVTLGEYEVGQPCAPGQDTAYGAGFFYRVEHHIFSKLDHPRSSGPSHPGGPSASGANASALSGPSDAFSKATAPKPYLSGPYESDKGVVEGLGFASRATLRTVGAAAWHRVPYP